MLGRSLLPMGILASAASSMPQSSPSATTSAIPTIHTVNVGRGNFQFDPNETYANAGDIVTFNFYPTNHSVVRAAYGLPCIPYEETGNDLTGFFSGNFLIDDLANPPQWNLTINDTQPVFYYCTAIGSCLKEGMVGVINPNASVSLEAQKQQALLSPYMLSPGQPFPSEEEGGTSGAPTPALTANPSLITATPTGDPTALASTAPATTSAASSSSSGSKLSGGAIAGIVIAGIVFVGLLAAVFWLLGNRRGTGSTAAAQSMLGQGNHERTEAWAAASNNGQWAGASDNGGRGPEMRYTNTWDGSTAFNQDQIRSAAASPTPSPGYMQSINSPTMAPGSPGLHSGPGPAPAYFPVHQPRAELQSNEVTELEAPHAIKY